MARREHRVQWGNSTGRSLYRGRTWRSELSLLAKDFAAGAKIHFLGANYQRYAIDKIILATRIC